LDWIRNHAKKSMVPFSSVVTSAAKWYRNGSHMYLFEENGVPVYNDVLDVGSWYLGLNDQCYPDASSKKASLCVLGVSTEPVFEFEHTHDAADDAAHIALRAAWVMRSLEPGVPVTFV
jgi:hypothetical protein